MAYTIKAINKMTEAEIEDAYQVVDMYEDRKAFRAIAKRRDELSAIRLAKIARFNALETLLLKDIEDGTFGTRYGSEDDHIEYVTIGEAYDFHIDANYR
jgi:hypothetical protein